MRRGQAVQAVALLMLVYPSGLEASTSSRDNIGCPSLLVVSGRVQFLRSQPANEPESTEWALANWRIDQNYRIKVAKVLIGTLPHHEITARVIAHGQIREDISFRFLLEHRGTEGYRIVQSLGRDYLSEFADICRDWAQ